MSKAPKGEWMINKNFPVFLSLFVLLLSILACNFVTGKEEGVTLDNVHTAFDQDGNNPTSIFAPADIFYVVGNLHNAPPGTILTSEWVAVQIVGYDPEEQIYEQTLNDFTEAGFTGTIYFQLSSDSGWPVGEYRVDVYLNGELVQSVPYSVQ